MEQKKYDEAIGTISDLVKGDPGNADLWLGLGSAYFSRAQAKDGDARKPDFALAGDAYAKAGELRTNDADLTFNAALAYQRAGQHDKAVTQWRRTLERRPDDIDALSALAESLTELGKFQDAVNVLHSAVVKTPQNGQLHRQYGAVLSKAGNTAKATEELLAFLAMKGTAAPDPAAAAKSLKGAAAAVLAKEGVPDAVYIWEGDGQKYQSWFYWSKKVAFHFNAQGAQAAKTDWSAPATVGAPPKK
jgi:tetratricopeptide (TPR) repeat protein